MRESKQLAYLILQSYVKGCLIQSDKNIQHFERGEVMSSLLTSRPPPLPRDGGTERTQIQVHTVNLIEIRLEER